MHGEKDGIDAEISLQWNDGYNPQEFSFANNINTHEGGTHLSGFRAALTRTVNSYAQKNNLVKDLKDASISGDDIREGMTAVISVKIPQPQFEGQTKTKLGNTEVKGIVETIVNDKLGQYLEENPVVAKKIVMKVVDAALRPRGGAQGPRPRAPQGRARGRLAARASSPTARNATRRRARSTSSRATRPAAPPSRAATGKFQAILPIKGKILNVERARLDRMLSSDEIKTIIAALGCGIGVEDFDIEKLRYHRIIIMTDADVDGSHIRTLLLTFFYRQMPMLIERGHLYIAQPPLFRAKRGRAETYIKDERELENFLVHRSVESRIVRAARRQRADRPAAREDPPHASPATSTCCTWCSGAVTPPTSSRRCSITAPATPRSSNARRNSRRWPTALTTPTRTVTCVRDDEHNAWALHVDDRTIGYSRTDTLGGALVASAEYRALEASYGEIGALARGLRRGGVEVRLAAGKVDEPEPEPEETADGDAAAETPKTAAELAELAMSAPVATPGRSRPRTARSR